MEEGLDLEPRRELLDLRAVEEVDDESLVLVQGLASVDAARRVEAERRLARTWACSEIAVIQGCDEDLRVPSPC